MNFMNLFEVVLLSILLKVHYEITYSSESGPPLIILATSQVP